MQKSIIGLFMFLYAVSAASTFAVPSTIDTVSVPVKLLKCVSISATTSYYLGKVTYDLRVHDNDSLSIALSFSPVGTGAAVVVDSVKGDIGIVPIANGINGTNDVYFWCHIAGTPAASYTATITINDGQSNVEKTTNALIAQMSNGEKAAQCYSNGNREYPDLSKYGGIPGLYMANGTSGPCQVVPGTSTSYPTGAAMTCTFDTTLMDSVGTAIAQEYWAKGHYMIEAPMVNMVIDPRGGRNWETFGEDPYLSAQIGVAYCKGAEKLHCIITAKHFICNDRENLRTVPFSSNLGMRPLREIYCMPFEYLVKEGKAWSVMTSYNKVNGIYSGADSLILNNILRYDWGFRGFTISDWDAMNNNTAAQCANAGNDVELPDATIYGQLANAVPTQVPQATLDNMARRVIRTKVWSGVIGKLGTSATTSFASTLECQNHKDLTLQVALKSIVLVKNANFGTPAAPALPLDPTKTVACVGSYYNQCRQWGVGAIASGRPCPDAAAGIQVAPDAGISARAGAKYMAQNWQSADQVVVVVGVSGEAENQDRSSLYITPANTDNTLIASIIAAGKKCVVVMTGGSPAVQEGWADAPAVLVEWYGGQAQGTALAQILYGDVNPSGRLSASFPANANQLPAFLETNNIIQYENYTNDFGRGYRYYDQNNLVPLYAFGFGLSYTTFQYSNMTISPSQAFVGQYIVTVDIKNSGTKAGDEVAQLYIHPNSSPKPRAVKELRGFARVSLNAGETKTVSFTIHERELAYFDDAANVNKFVVAPGDYTILVGPSSFAGQALTAFPVSKTLTVE